MRRAFALAIALAAAVPSAAGAQLTFERDDYSAGTTPYDVEGRFQAGELRAVA